MLLACIKTRQCIFHELRIDTKYPIGAQVKKLDIVKTYNIENMKSKQSKLQGKRKVKIKTQG